MLLVISDASVRMRDSGSRLPWNEVEKTLKQYEVECLDEYR